MAGLTTVAEITRSGRELIAKTLKGDSLGISHIAIGTGPVGGFTLFPNPRIGNNIQIDFNGVSVTIHNDIPVFNFGPNGLIDKYYFIEEVNTGRDLTLTFGASETGSEILKVNKFNHLFMTDLGPSGAFGIANLLNAPTTDATRPVGITDEIAYLGYVETDSIEVRAIRNPASMFKEIAQAVPTIDFIGDKGIAAIDPLSLDPGSVVTFPAPTLMVKATFGPIAAPDTIREVAVLGDGGNDVIAFTRVFPDLPLVVGQKLLVRMQLTF